MTNGYLGGWPYSLIDPSWNGLDPDLGNPWSGLGLGPNFGSTQHVTRQPEPRPRPPTKEEIEDKSRREIGDFCHQHKINIKSGAVTDLFERLDKAARETPFHSHASLRPDSALAVFVRETLPKELEAIRSNNVILPKKSKVPLPKIEPLEIEATPVAKSSWSFSFDKFLSFFSSSAAPKQPAKEKNEFGPLTRISTPSSAGGRVL